MKNKLNNILKKCHNTELIGLDPLIVVHRYKESPYLEQVAFLSACLAYGRVERILISLEHILGVCSGNIEELIEETTLTKKRTLLKTFRHRFNTGDDVALLLQLMKISSHEYGSLEEIIADGLKTDGSMKTALTHFSYTLKKMAQKMSTKSGRSFDYFLPSPEGGSACKRLNMFLRWVVRKNDGIDLGLWKKVSPAHLIIPVDTHILAVSQELGLTKRKSADWKTAEEITHVLRKYSPKDPIKYDFALCHYGMLKVRE